MNKKMDKRIAEISPRKDFIEELNNFGVVYLYDIDKYSTEFYKEKLTQQSYNRLLVIFREYRLPKSIDNLGLKKNTVELLKSFNIDSIDILFSKTGTAYSIVKTDDIIFEDLENFYKFHNKIFIESSFKHWLNETPEKFVLYATLIGTFFFTAFLDFRVQGTPIRLQSHIAAAYKASDTSIGLVLFLIVLFSILQAVNAVSFKGKKSPVSFIMFNIVTLIEIGLIVKYILIFIAKSSKYSLEYFDFFSMGIMVLGLLFFIFASILSIKFVDWQYVKVKDE